MKKKLENGDVLFKAGLFIIFTLALLLFSVLWLRYFSLTPDKIIIAKFADSGPISKGIPVYYHGVNIGKIDGTEFSKDFKYTLVHILIYKKNMDLPKNVYAEIRTTGLTGQTYLEIIYPNNPSSEILKNGDTIEGRLSAIQLVQKTISVAIKNGTIENTIKEVHDTTVNTSDASKKMTQVLILLDEIMVSNRDDFRTLVKKSALSANNVQITSDSIKKLSTSTELQQNIRSTISNMSKSSQKMDKITTDVDKITGDPKLRHDILKTSSNAGDFSERLNKGDLNCLITKTLLDTDKTVNRYDCIGESFSQMMTERFLLMRLMFGKPGKSFKKCTNLQCIEEQMYNTYPCPTYSCPSQQ